MAEATRDREEKKRHAYRGNSEKPFYELFLPPPSLPSHDGDEDTGDESSYGGGNLFLRTPSDVFLGNVLAPSPLSCGFFAVSFFARHHQCHARILLRTVVKGH